jgi:YVTN family beta-propeller protein
MLSIPALSLVVVASVQSPGLSPDADPPVTIERRSAVSQMPPIAKAPPGPAARGVASSFVFTGDNPEGDAPSDVAFTPDGSTIVIAHRESRNLILWDAQTRAFLGEAPVSGAPQSLAITPDGSTALVANIDNDTLSFVDLDTLTETQNIPVGTNPGVVRVSPAGDLGALTQTFDAQLAVVDLATATVVRTIDDIGSSVTLSFSPEPPAASIQYSGFEFIDADRIINLDAFADEAQIVNVRTGSVTRLAIAPNARDLSVSLDGTRAAISHGSSTRLVTVIDLETESVLNTWPTSVDLFGEITINADGTKGVVATLNAARAIDLTTGALGASLDTASVNELLTTSDGLYALGVGFRGALIDFATGSLVAQLNNVVSTQFGAVSPTAPLGAMCSTTFGDDLVVVSTNGGAGQLEAFQLSGPAPEGDRCRTGAISADGSVGAGVSILSDTLSVIDPATGSVTGHAPLGMRPSGVAITPDATTAVVANLDSTFASVVDLATATSVSVPISRRAAQVEISPDGLYAYLAVVADGDGVWRINLSTNAVEGPKRLTGNMGGVGYSYSQSSGIALSPDGATLAVAGSFTDNVSLIDTASWTLLANVPTGDFPSWVAFSPDSQTVYAAIKNTDEIDVLDLTGPPARVDTISVGDQPWHMVDLGDGRLAVNNWGDASIGIVDLSLGVQTHVIPLPDACVGLTFDAQAGLLYAANGADSTTLGGMDGFSQSQEGRVSVIDVATNSIVDTIDLGVAPAGLAMSAGGAYLLAPAPSGDGAAVVSLTSGCNPADLSEPFGTLDFDDALAFLSAFGAEDPLADLAQPHGAFDFDDVLAFLNAFLNGCP